MKSFKSFNIILLLAAILITNAIFLNKINIKNILFPKDNLESVLQLAGENRNELEKVMNHYKTSGDSLKLEAACFLIKKMPGHYHIQNESLKDFSEVANELPDTKKPLDRIKMFQAKIDSLKKAVNWTASENKIVTDIEHISSEFLINNIDLAFKAWEKIPPTHKADFNEFCEFVLPYRNSNEPLESDSREKLFNKYNWVYDSLDCNVSLNKVIIQVIGTFNFNSNINYHYQYPLSVSQAEALKFGNCNDGVNYAIHVFRAVGIACYNELIPYWGNYSQGHDFLAVKIEDGFYATDVDMNSIVDLKTIFRKESIPKVFRKTFSHNINSITGKPENVIDVTKDYKTTVDIEVDAIFNNQKLPKVGEICVFDYYKTWSSVTEAKISNGKLNATELGTRVVYMAGIAKGGTIKCINYPFYVDSLRKIHFLKPKKELHDSILLTRKHPLCSERNKTKVAWMSSLNGCVFEGANIPDFSDAQKIAEIQNHGSTHLTSVSCTDTNKYKFVRLLSDHRTYVAELYFYDNHQNKLSGKKFQNIKYPWMLRNNIYVYKNYYGKVIERTSDGDPLTFFGGDGTVYIGLAFEKPQIISRIEIQPRNDDNHINKGETYELFYWDENWKSLGSKVASDTLLVYKNIPKNSLFWLRNLTKGKEEHVFTIDENGRQNWPGSIM